MSLYVLGSMYGPDALQFPEPELVYQCTSGELLRALPIAANKIALASYCINPNSSVFHSHTWTHFLTQMLSKTIYGDIFKW